MRYFFVCTFLIIMISCSKQEVPSSPIFLSADVRMYKPNGETLNWYTLIYSSRPIEAKTIVDVEWTTTDESGRVLDIHHHVSTIEAGRPDPAVSRTISRAEPSQKAISIRILSVACEDTSLEFDY